ncbi:hypothetical protein GE061_005945 [Apolygus lucorum]|uniref:DUF659 domain-containing protein n=1 Tax=Apolygus lucorum TaxID=248454 RepID=A0A8S9WSK5_APOLU|nr:hypothetical protein GE061_005945 [Apolygus lucorum]
MREHVYSFSEINRYKYYLLCYVIEKIRDEIEDSPIWCSVDETTDWLGRNMVNVIVGKLSGKSASKGRLIHVAVVDKTNASMILQCVQEGLRILWKGAPGTTGRLKLFVTDCAAYMLKAGDHLKAMYPMVVHLTCFSHGLHRVAEAVREEYPTVNKLISSTKKVFLKAPARVDLFRTMLPNTPLPPEPIITRWGTWLEAGQYYAENVSAIRCVFDSLDTNEAQAIRKAKEALAASELETHLHYISDNFGSLPSTI